MRSACPTRSRSRSRAPPAPTAAGYASTGAATYCLIPALERRGLDLTYGQLLVEMHNTLQRELGSGGGGGGVGGLMGMLMGPTGGFRCAPRRREGAACSQAGGRARARCPGRAGGRRREGRGCLEDWGLREPTGAVLHLRRGQEPVLSANYAFDLSYKFSL